MPERRRRASADEQLSLLPPPPGRRNRVVEAGAGTGKTTSIVRSVVELLLDDPALSTERIVLVTFTEKAAGEIADRIRHALVELDASLASSSAPQWPSAGAAIISIPPERRDSAQTAVAKHLQQIDLLRSQTIHSFCQALLRMYPIEAGLDPQFALVEGFERARLYDRIYRDWFDSETRDGKRRDYIAEWEAAFGHLRNVDGIRSRIFSLAARRDLVEAVGLSPGGIADFEKEVVPRLETIRAMAAGDVSRIDHAANREAVVAIRAAELPMGGTLEEWLGWFEAVATPLSRVSMQKKKGLPEDVKIALQELRGESGDARVVEHLLRHRAAVALLAMTRRFIAFRDAEKDRRGVVDFDDLLFRAQRLLDRPEVLAALRNRYDYIFVDEFQDTDRVQADIISRLARNASGEFVAGKTVLVGDPKQSIYGFRRADPETYAATVAEFVRGGAAEEVLDTQYRSDAALVDGLNTLFSQLFSEKGTRSVARPVYNELEPGRGNGSERDARFTFLHVDCGEDEDAYVAEARAIAAWINARDPEHADLREFALLFRTRTQWPQYLDTLTRCGIPYVVQPMGAFLDTPVAVDLLTVLRAAALPFDDAALVSAARTVYFGLSDDEIVRERLHVTAGSLLEGIKRTLDSWRRVAEGDGVAAAVDALIADTQIESVYGSLQPTEAAQSLAHLAGFRRMAVDWDLAAGGSLRQFVEELARRQAEQDEIEPSLVDDARNAVRILTAHAAKGLEFGTVILPAMSARGGGNHLEVYAVESEEPTLVTKGESVDSLSGTYRTADGFRLTEIAKQRALAEDDRLFYVAVTRAIREVVFVCNPEKLRNVGFWNSLNRIVGIETKSMGEYAPANPGRAIRELAVGERKLTVAFERVTPAEMSAAPDRFATSAVGALIEREPRSEPETEAAPEQRLDPVAVKRAVASAANIPVGTLMHRVLEGWDFERATLDSTLAAAAAELGSAPAAVARVRKRLARLEASPALARIRAAKTVGREMPIWYRDADGAVVTKRPDRLLLEETAFLVVDYKSGSPSDTWGDRYREQVAEYCQAIERMSERPCRGLIWYIDDEADAAVEVPGRS